MILFGSMMFIAMVGIAISLFYLVVALTINSDWSNCKSLYIDWDGIKKSVKWMVFFIAIALIDFFIAPHTLVKDILQIFFIAIMYIAVVGICVSLFYFVVALTINSYWFNWKRPCIDWEGIIKSVISLLFFIVFALIGAIVTWRIDLSLK